ncbi:MAG: glycine dehydrogenase, partial [Deltaproteobacteria bacterium]|nr:glycine dehydrogenase [Deltaproteobacteria bacterium]
LGFMACRDGDKRQMPGRITGQTVDADGRRGFVLTLSTREQHIRREKATSNICTNQSLMMLRAVIYLALMGRDGLGQAARQNAALTHYFAAQAAAIPGYRLRFTGSRFNEVALTAPVGAEQIVALGAKKGVAPGLALGAGPLGGGFPREANTLLVAVTEARSKAEIDQLIELLKEAAR